MLSPAYETRPLLAPDEDRNPPGVRGPVAAAGVLAWLFPPLPSLPHDSVTATEYQGSTRRG